MNVFLPEFDFAEHKQLATPRDDVNFANMALPAPRNDIKATKPIP